MSEPRIARHVLAEGLVQGVGYREFTRRWAMRLNISGWVRNRSQGMVEAVISGAASDVAAMLERMREGPPGAGVHGLTIAEHGNCEGSAGFTVRPTQ